MIALCIPFWITLTVIAQDVVPSEPTGVDLERLLNDLGDPSYQMRQAAVEKLYAAGPAVLEALAEVTKGGDFEAALRARHLIERIQKLFFVGARGARARRRPQRSSTQGSRFETSVRNSIATHRAIALGRNQ